MSNYLNQLVAKSFNLTDTVQPLLVSMFEPIPESAGMVGVVDSNWEQQAVSNEESQLETEWDTWISTIFAIEEPSEWQLPSTLHSGESPATSTPEELNYQESPDLISASASDFEELQSTDLTPASASDFEELQSTDLTLASALISEELLKLAPQLPQVNSEPSPNETLSQPIVIEPTTEQVLSNPDRQKLTPAVEVETNLSQATPPVEQNPQPAHESSWNPPTIINRVVSTTPQQLVEPLSHIIPPPQDVESLLGVESQLVTSTQRDDDSWQESANQPLPQSAVISPMTHNPQSTSTTQPNTFAIARQTIVPLVSGAPVPQSTSTTQPNTFAIATQTIVPPVLSAPVPQSTSTTQPNTFAIATQTIVPPVLSAPVPQSTSTTQPNTFAIGTQTIVTPVFGAPVPQLLPKPEFSKLIETHRVVSTTPSQQVFEPNSHIIPPPGDIETKRGEETLQIMSTPEPPEDYLINKPLRREERVRAASPSGEETRSVILYREGSKLGDDHRQQQLANPLLPQSAFISPITQNIQSSSLTQPVTSAIALETIVPPVSPAAIPQLQSKPQSQKLVESHRLVSKTPSQQVCTLNSDIIHPSADVETLLCEETLQITSRRRDDDSRQQLANPLLPQSTLISPITQNIQSSSLTQPVTSAIALETIVPPVSPAAIPQLQSKHQSQKLIESHRLVSKTPSQQVLLPNSHIIHPSGDVKSLVGEETLQITSRHSYDRSRQQLANPLLPQSTLISPITQNIQSTLTQPKTRAIATQTIVPPVKSAPVPQLLPKPEFSKLIETHRVVSTTPSQQIVQPLSHIIPLPTEVETLLGVESQLVTSTQRDEHSWEQSAHQGLPQSAVISPVTHNPQSTSTIQPNTFAIATQTIFPPVKSAPVSQLLLKPESSKLIETPRLVSTTPSQQVVEPNSHIIPPPGNVETLLGEETLQIMSKLGDDRRRQQLANPLLPQSAFISPITQNIQSSSLTQPKTRAIATETIVPPVVLQQQSKPQSEKLIESHRLVSKTSSQHVLAPNSHIIHPYADVESFLGKLRSCTNPWRIEFAAIQTKSAYADSQKIKGLKPAKAGFVCVAANSIRQVQDVSKETLQITSRQRDEHRQQLANPLLPQSTVISPITQNIQSSSLTQPQTRAIATETIVPLANSNIQPPHLPTPKSSKKGFIEINPVASFPQLPVVSSNSRRLSPLLQDVENLQVTSQKVLPNLDRQPLTSANVQQTNLLHASPPGEPQQKQNNESINNQPIKIHRVASSSQLQEMEKQNPHIIPSSAQNVKTLHVTSLQDGEMTSQLSLNQPQLLSGEILPALMVLSTPDRQPLTPANPWETNVPLATPAAVPRPDFSRHVEKPTQNLTPQPPSLKGSGENSKPLSLQERGLERGFPDPVKSKVPRQQPATKFLENSPVQINIAPETNTAFSNSVPEPQQQSAPELSGIQQHVVNPVISSPQLPVVAPLPQQSFLETNDTPRGNRLGVTRGHGDRETRRNFYEKQLNEFDMTTGLADSKANTATGMIHPLTTAPVVQPLENFASSDLPNSRILESSTTHEQLSPSQYTKIIQQSLEKIIHWKDVAGQVSYSAVEASSQRLEHLIGLHLQEKFRNLATPPNIKISIGRVEIRATQQPKPERQKPRPMPSSVMSLDEYLRRRAKGGWR